MLLLKDLYLLNKSSHTLHIKSYCDKAAGCNCIPFETENDAVKYAGRSLKMCEDCMKEREKILESHVKQKTCQNNKRVND